MATRKRKLFEGDIVQLHDKLSALSKADSNKLNLSGLKILHSANIDEDYRQLEPNATRWDYYLGTEKHGEIYVEVHRVDEDELERIFRKAAWLKAKIEELGWPYTPGRPYLVAPTAGITPGLIYGTLRKRLVLKKIDIVMKGSKVVELLL